MRGDVAKWQGKALQKPDHGFKSHRRLKKQAFGPAFLFFLGGSQMPCGLGREFTTLNKNLLFRVGNKGRPGELRQRQDDGQRTQAARQHDKCNNHLPGCVEDAGVRQ